MAGRATQCLDAAHPGTFVAGHRPRPEEETATGASGVGAGPAIVETRVTLGMAGMVGMVAMAGMAAATGGGSFACPRFRHYNPVNPIGVLSYLGRFAENRRTSRVQVPMSRPTLDDLPAELLLLVFLHLVDSSPTDVASLSRCSKSFQVFVAVNERLVWSNLCDRRWGTRLYDSPPDFGEGYRDYYRKRYILENPQAKSEFRAEKWDPCFWLLGLGPRKVSVRE
jgi:hypothetical protein